MHVWQTAFMFICICIITIQTNDIDMNWPWIDRIDGMLQHIVYSMAIYVMHSVAGDAKLLNDVSASEYNCLNYCINLYVGNILKCHIVLNCQAASCILKYMTCLSTLGTSMLLQAWFYGNLNNPYYNWCKICIIMISCILHLPCVGAVLKEFEMIICKQTYLSAGSMSLRPTKAISLAWILEKRCIYLNPDSILRAL